jgi:hypothetical protein
MSQAEPSNVAASVLLHLREFLLLPLKAASEQDQVPKSWSAGGPWVYAKSEIEKI